MGDSSQSIKHCPDCGEGVEHKASLCRFCGYIFPLKGFSGVTTIDLASGVLSEHGFLERLASRFSRRVREERTYA